MTGTLTDAFPEIVVRIAYTVTERLIRRVRRWVTKDELLSVALMAGRDVYDRYLAEHDADRAKLTTRLSIRMYGSLIDYLRQVTPHTRTAMRRLAEGENVPYTTSLTVNRSAMEEDYNCRETGYWFREPPARESRDPQFWRDDFLGTLTELLPGISKRTRHILTRYFVDGVVMRQIGEENGMSESRVSQLITSTIADIQAAVRERDRGRQPVTPNRGAHEQTV